MMRDLKNDLVWLDNLELQEGNNIYFIAKHSTERALVAEMMVQEQYKRIDELELQLDAVSRVYNLEHEKVVKYENALIEIASMVYEDDDNDIEIANFANKILGR